MASPIRFSSWCTHSSEIFFLTFLFKVETTRKLNSKTSENVGKAPLIRGSGGYKVSEVWLTMKINDEAAG